MTLKRAFFLIGFFIIFPMVQLFNALCFVLDEIFYPGYRKIEIEKPVFITGNPRSGTSFIHRLMAGDERQFFFFKTWEIIFPAIIQKKFLAFIGRVDRLFGSIFSAAIKRLEERIFQNFNRIHRLGLFYAEEDDKLLAHIFSCFDLVYFFPFFEVFDWHCRFDMAAKPDDQKRIMTFYVSCLKRQAYFKGNRGHLLSKSPFFCSKIESLFEYFPDARIIYLIRNPLEVIPSMISMAYEIWNSTVGADAAYSIEDKTYEMARLFYEYPLTRLNQAPRSSYVLVNYNELVCDPSKVIHNIYQKFACEITSAVKKNLDDQESKARSYRSSHVYSLDDFNTSREQITSDLDFVFRQFNFSDTVPP
jgi:hypothetical protein